MQYACKELRWMRALYGMERDDVNVSNLNTRTQSCPLTRLEHGWQKLTLFREGELEWLWNIWLQLSTRKPKKKTFSEKMLRKEKKLSLAKVKTKVEFIHSWLIRFLLGVRFTDLTACRPSSIAVLYDHGNEALCITVQVSFNQSGRMPVLEEAMTSRFYCFARKSQKINARKYGLSKKLDSRFHRSISENFKASLSNVPWARVGNFWKSESIKSLSFWKGLRRSRRHFDRHRM